MENASKKILAFTIVVCVMHYFHLVGRMHGMLNNFVITCFSGFVLTYLALRLNPFKKIGLYVIYFPMILLTATVIAGFYYDMKMPGFMGYLMYLVSTGFGTALFYKRNKRRVAVIYGILLVPILFNTQNLHNWHHSLYDKHPLVGAEFPEIQLYDRQGKTHTLNVTGKITVLDFWSNDCFNCIAAFPKFEELKKHYENDEQVQIMAVNIYRKDADIAYAEKYLKQYTFPNYYNPRLFEQLNFNSVPNYVIIGKDGKVKYFGSLYAGTLESYNNIYKLIENEKL